jgi:transcriptional regulator with GAF, ATPase, and Fis domain
LLSALSQTNWNKSQAAERLHWSRMTLYRKMAKYHIQESTSEKLQRSLAANNFRNNLGADVTKV